MRFTTLLLDPPWPESGGGKVKRGADRHYPLMKARDMPGVILGSGLWTPAEHAHVWMWTTNTYLPGALWLLGQLGAAYRTNVVWVKDGRPGLGQYFRGKHELLLFATFGNGKNPTVFSGRRDLPTVIVAARGRHSAKPEAAYRLIEDRSVGERVEFFARAARSGWVSWGPHEGLAPAIDQKKAPVE